MPTPAIGSPHLIFEESELLVRDCDIPAVTFRYGCDVNSGQGPQITSASARSQVGKKLPDAYVWSGAGYTQLE